MVIKIKNTSEKQKIYTQSMQIPIPLKQELDKIKIIPRESYPSVIQRLVEEHYNNNEVVKSPKNKKT